MLGTSTSLLLRAARHLPPLRRLHQARETMRQERDGLSAQLDQARSEIGSVFHHFNACFDPKQLVQHYAVTGVSARDGYLTNFLGVVIDPKFLPALLAGRAGQVEPVPIPANWHADLAEWGAVLRAVELATDRFTVLELGCGWGCWMVNAGAAARRRGLAVHLIGIEADAGHVGFAQEACAANGFAPDQVTLHRGVAAATGGVALFARAGQPGTAWGTAPLFDVTPAQRTAAVEAGTHDAVPMVALSELVVGHARIDLLHIDIQGGEADLVAANLTVLGHKVAYIVIGTHSREIEGRLFALMRGAGWQLEIERPAILALGDAGPVVTVDGVQGWRNLDLFAGTAHLSPISTCPSARSPSC